MNTQIPFVPINLSESDRKYGTWLAYAFLFFYYVRPQEYIPGMSAIPVAGVVSLVFAVWGVVHIRPTILKSPLFVICMLGFVYSLAAIDAVNVRAHRVAFFTFIEVLPQCVALYIIFDSRDRVVNLYKLWCVIYFFMALITIKNGGRGPGDFSGDENDAALALSIGFPFCFYGMWYPSFDKRFKYFAAFTSLLIATAIIGTASRGGFLGFIGVLLILWWLSQKKIKVAIYAILLSLVLSGLVLSVLPEGYIDEVQSINDTEDNTRLERFRLWETAWEMYKDNPFVGVGAGNQRFHMLEYSRNTSWYTGASDSPNYQGKVTHSVYFQVISETGTLGALIYLYIMLILPLKLYIKRKSFKSGDDEQFIRMLFNGLIAAMGAYVVSGTFISVAYYPHLSIWVTMYAIILRLTRLDDSSNEKPSESKILIGSEHQPKVSGFLWENEK